MKNTKVRRGNSLIQPRSSIFLITLMFSMVMLFGLASASESYKVNTVSDLPFKCLINDALPSAAATLNITISYPNGSIMLDNVETSRRTALGSFNYTTTFPVTGIYLVDVDCVDGANSYSMPGTYEVTPSGSLLGQGQSIALFGSLIVMIIVSLIFLLIAIRSESSAAKISFYVFSVIGFIMVILYTVIIIQQTLFGFESILTGVETFWFVAKMGLTVGILAFGIVIFLVMLKAWKIKRGMYDAD